MSYLSLQKRLSTLKTAAHTRKLRLNDSAAFLQFNWKADVIESWISEPIGLCFCNYSYFTMCTGDKEGQVRSEEYGKDISSVQTLITKQETFDAGLAAFQNESIASLTTMKDELLANKHTQAVAIRQRHLEVTKRYRKKLTIY